MPAEHFEHSTVLVSSGEHTKQIAGIHLELSIILRVQGTIRSLPRATRVFFQPQHWELGYETALPLQVVPGRRKTKPHDSGAHSRARECWVRMGDAKCSRGLELSSCAQIHYRHTWFHFILLGKSAFESRYSRRTSSNARSPVTETPQVVY